MSYQDIIRAWKDAGYRESLSEEQRSQLPENPAGTIEIPEQDMESIAGGGDSINACGQTTDPNMTACTDTRGFCTTVSIFCDPQPGPAEPVEP